MLQVIKEETDRKLAFITSRLNTTNDNARWYSTFAMAESAGVVAIIRMDGQSISLQISLTLLGLSLLAFILSVFRSMLIRREMTGKASDIISRFSELEVLGKNIEHRKEEVREILEKWRSEYTTEKMWDTEKFNSLGLVLFGVGTIFAFFGLLKIC